MTILSLEFLVFIAALAVVYYLCPLKIRKWTLLLGSALFWLRAGWQGTIYLAAEALVVFFAARQMEKGRGRRAWLGAALGVSFAGMLLLKEAARREMGLFLPLGLSYFTFQSTGYLIDVSRGKVKAEKNYLKVLLFCGFFPSLSQGPIGTWKALFPQLDAPHRLSPEGFVSGVFLMAWGFFKKMVIADRLSPVVTSIVRDYQTLPGWMALLAAGMFAIALYCDFSGGIDIVRGAAELFGIHLEKNFNHPFFAISVADYWRRWHISLGAWLRTYLMYPLVTSRAGVAVSRWGKRFLGAKTGRALPGALAALLVFVLIGIWHVLSLNALLYGLWFGLLTFAAMMLEAPFKALKRKLGIGKNTRWFKAYGLVRTWILVLAAQFFACTEQPAQAFGMLGRVFTAFGAKSAQALPMERAEGLVACVALVVVGLVDLLCERKEDFRLRLSVAPLYLRWPALLLLIFATLIFGCYGYGYDAAAFFYAGF